MTNSVNCSHRLELTNLADGEVVSHAILLIKGRISQIKSPGPASVGKCEAEELKLKFRNLCEDDSSSDWEQLTTRVTHSGQFKLLLDLQRYEAAPTARDAVLQLHLEYCSLLEQLTVHYRPSTARFRLQPLYIICSDAGDAAAPATPSSSTSAACQVIDLNLRLVQCVYAEQLRAAGFARRTFALNGTCQVFYSQLTRTVAWQCNENELWQHFGEELLNSSSWRGDPTLKFVAFIDCTAYDGSAVAASGDFSYANIRRHLRAHAALGGGGLALFGSAYFYAWPQHFGEITDCFRSEKTVNPALLPDDSNYRRTYGGVYATTLGAIVHEVGHIFELGHTSDGIMGSGFDYINHVFTVDNLTEHLPDRVIQGSGFHAPIQSAAVRPRFTQLKKTANSFLQKYREQKANDSFYFTRNCAVILAHHKWLSGATVEQEVEIVFEEDSNSVVATADSLRLIEVRCAANSLVKLWYELPQPPQRVEVFRFPLPAAALAVLQHNHYLFVLSASGCTKRLCETEL